MSENDTSHQETFADLLQETLEGGALEGRVVPGKIVGESGDMFCIDVSMKSEGWVPKSEFVAHNDTVQVGDVVDVLIERMEDRNGDVKLSREKAHREEVWINLEGAFQKNETVSGRIFGRVKGGFTVDLKGAVAFLPGSQVDIRPVRDVEPLMESDQPFQILKMDRKRSNIVVSRRAILESSRKEVRTEVLSGLSEGQVLDGVVKNITDYGAFVDLGGIDGLLHVTDMSWQRVTHPSEIVSVDQPLKVKVLRFDPETQRIALGIKQLGEDPWTKVEERYTADTKVMGRVTNITDYGAFVELEPGVEGLVHVSEMSWTKKNMHPGKLVSTSQEVEVCVLEVSEQRKRISLGIKQCMENPWELLEKTYPVGSELEGTVRSITDFGLFVSVVDGIDGMVHASDLDWSKSPEEALSSYKKGQTVHVTVLEIDQDKARVGLGVKQLTDDPFAEIFARIKVGEVVTCTIKSVGESGLEVLVDGLVPGFVRRSDLSRDKAAQRPDRFAEGEKMDAKVLSVENRRFLLSIKAHEMEEERQMMETYGSSDSGALLGDILGKALKEKENNEGT